MAVLLTADDVQGYLGTAQGDLGNTALVDLYIAAVTPVIESLTGPITVQDRTRAMSGDGSRALAMPWPFTAVTSIVENGILLSSSDYYTEGSTGLIYRGALPGMYYIEPAASPYYLRYWPYGMDNVIVTVTTGVTVVPGNVRLAALELFKHLWSTRSGARPAFGNRSPDDAPYVPSGFAVPHKVTELLLSTPQLPGFA